MNGELYRTMLTIRRFEERVVDLVNANEIAGVTHEYVGQEAVAAGVCAALRADDVITSTHRGHGHVIAKGADVRRMMAELLGRVDGLNRGRGGSMHVADLGLGIYGANGIVAAGAPFAAGAAWSFSVDGSGRVAVTFFGDGGANQGVLHETMNLAALWQLPLVFVCENNGYAVTLPQERSTAGSIVARAAAYGMAAEQVDGMDVEAVLDAARARGRDGARGRRARRSSSACTYRFFGHHTAERTMKLGYRTDEEIERWRERDPVPAAGAALDPAERERIDAEVEALLDEAVAFARESPHPDPAGALDYVYASGLRAAGGVVGVTPLRYLQALGKALRDEMAADPSVFVIGEDVRASLRGVTTGLLDEFGPDRVLDMPISEQAFTSFATGAALAGRRCVVEFQIPSLLYLAFEQIANQAQKLRLMTGGQAAVPVVYLVPGSGARLGLAGQHSDHPYSLFAHAGVKTVVPATPADAYGLCSSRDPRRRPGGLLRAGGRAAGARASCPTSRRRCRSAAAGSTATGTDVTVVAVGHLVHDALAVAEELADEVSVEVFDPRTLYPFDWELLAASLARTGRLVVFDDANRTCGFAAEIVATAAEEMPLVAPPAARDPGRRADRVRRRARARRAAVARAARRRRPRRRAGRRA